MVPSDDDGDDYGIFSICDKILSFSFYDDNDEDDDEKRYRHDNFAVTVNDAAPWSTPNS